MPLLFIFMATFISNDLDDLERDRINHPDRPLPQHKIKLTSAVILLFACLVTALVLTNILVSPPIAFWYYFLMVFSISYSYIVDFLPSIKAPYVAANLSVPIIIIATYYPNDHKLYVVAGSCFLLTLGRELCMDINDRPGDSLSALNNISSRYVAFFAFASQFAGLLGLAVMFRRCWDMLMLCFMLVIFIASAISWFSCRRCKRAARIMKLQLLLGIYFLI